MMPPLRRGRISDTASTDVCIFLHNMKVAGTTFNHICKRQYTRDLRFKIQGKRMDSHLNEFCALKESDRRRIRF